MNRRLSSYLDLLRICAATAVLLSHFGRSEFDGGPFWRLQPLGHYPVLVFFVLSGFVIAYTAEQKEHSLKEFVISRLARLYSVVIPALILTLCLDRLGMVRDPGGYALTDETFPLVRLATAALFLTQAWFLNIPLFSNNPYWSLPYEFWYYAMFAGAFYLSGRRRMIWIAICAAISGPNILLLLPIWGLGVLAYRIVPWFRIDGRAAVSIFALTATLFFAIVFLDYFGYVQRARVAYLPPGFTRYDYFLGVLVALNLLSASRLSLPLERLSGLIKGAASFTFSVYLYHLPLLHVFAAYVPRTVPAAVRGPLILALTVSSIVLLGSITEKRKHVLKAWLVRAFQFFSQVTDRRTVVSQAVGE